KILSISLRLLMVQMVLLMASPANLAGAASPPSQPDFGPNVIIFDPGMPLAQIQAQVNAIAAQQVDSEMGTQRYALLFKPGTYGTPATPLVFQVGYYTEVAGLGLSPTDVVINGHVDVYNRCLTASNCLALVNFWRSLSNLTINVMGLSGCRSSGDFWAVSQAAPMRRVKIAGGNLTLMDYCTAGPQYASGGFIADTQTAFIINGSQQQFLVRDSQIGGWSNGVWNQVFSGVVGAPAQSFPNPPYTTLPASPLTRERPFLYVDSSGSFNVFVPDPRSNSAGTTWASGPAAGASVPINQFFVASPADDAQTINVALASGKNLIFTPGIYPLDRTVAVKSPDTVVLGLGFPTLVPQDGITAMTVANVKGVKIAGLIFDAGPVNSPVLLQVGALRAVGAQAQNFPPWSDPADPTTLSDVFFRIGGATPGKATVSLIVNSDNVLLDDIWAWRADHGNGVGWTDNTADTGVIVNGDHVTAYGLFVEHYQKYDLIWNGENGSTIMFQNEMPYDPPDQASWSHDGVNGFAAYKVADTVQTHEAWGLGSYSFFNVGPDIHSARGFEVPVTAGVKLHDILTVYLSGNGGIDHVVNDTGAAVNINNQVSDLVSFP
ncbi:MAG TPA: coagulation factor 5/8 type domain-containing protein, partial [Anaerolineales bacterium]